MQVLALIEGTDHPCYRYRLEAFAWSMAQQGLYLEALPLRRGLLPRIAQLFSVRRADVVILQRKLLPLWQLALLRGAAKRLIYDVDDALFQRDSYQAKGPMSRMRHGRFAATVRVADLVIAGNEYLREQVAAHTEPGGCGWFPPASSRHGTPSPPYTDRSCRPTGVDRPTQHPLLAAMRRATSDRRGRVPAGASVAGDFRFGAALSGVRVVPRPWSSATEAVELAHGDIGVSWLPDDAWSRGKCGLRVLQYMAAGLPVVANPVGMNRTMVVHGETGFLASTPQEWAAAITCLAADPACGGKWGRPAGGWFPIATAWRDGARGWPQPSPPWPATARNAPAVSVSFAP